MTLLQTSSGLHSNDDIYHKYHFRREPMECHKKVLFVLKDRVYNSVYADSFGLINSAKQVAQYLDELNYHTKIVSVFDGNSIDKELVQFKPDIVIIEALWVPTYKLEELISLPRYKNIKWIVRVHSEIGFLSAESNALKYINEYIDLKKQWANLFISFNSIGINDNMNKIKQSGHINIYENLFDYLPNIISNANKNHHDDESYGKTFIYNIHNHHWEEVINIGCFGSLRLMKNQVFQAMCAIEFANRNKKHLRFHINTQVTNTDSVNPILNNLVELFKDTNHQLILHKWYNHADFLRVVKRMTMGMQLSFTESFNIVTSDFIACDVPIIVSPAIDWLFGMKTSTTNYDDVIWKITVVYYINKILPLRKLMNLINRYSLRSYNKKAKRIWKRFLHSII